MPDDDTRLMRALEQLAELLERLDHVRAAEVRELAAMMDADSDEAMRRLDGNHWWAGAGSLAAETMAENPGLSEPLWTQEVREFRRLMIEIGEALRARGRANPGISSWLLAFNQWNASEV